MASINERLVLAQIENLAASTELTRAQIEVRKAEVLEIKARIKSVYGGK